MGNSATPRHKDNPEVLQVDAHPFPEDPLTCSISNQVHEVQLRYQSSTQDTEHRQILVCTPEKTPNVESARAVTLNATKSETFDDDERLSQQIKLTSADSARTDTSNATKSEPFGDDEQFAQQTSEAEVVLSAESSLPSTEEDSEGTAPAFENCVLDEHSGAALGDMVASSVKGTLLLGREDADGKAPAVEDCAVNEHACAALETLDAESLNGTPSGDTSVLDQPGWYQIVEDDTAVTEGRSTESPDVVDLARGKFVKVAEVVFVESEERIRGRIVASTESGFTDLIGWVSLQDTGDGFRWATKVEDSCVDMTGHGQIVQDVAIVAEDVSAESQEAATVVPCLDTPGLYQIIEDDTVVTYGSSTESEEVAELAHGTVVEVVEVAILLDEERIRGRIVPRAGVTPVVPEGWISLHDTGDGFCWAMKFEETTEDAPGLYEIVEDGTVVTSCVSTETKEIAELEHGTVVHVVEVVVVPDEKRIRGRVVPRPGTNTAVLAGWISLHDCDDGFRWANKVQASCHDEPGIYLIVEDDTIVTEGPSTKSAEVAELDHGSVIEVVEIAVLHEEDRIRGRIEAHDGSENGPPKPAGWISLHDTSDGFRWATKVDSSHVDGPGTYVVVEDETVVTVGSSVESEEVAELAHGTRVEVAEVRIMGDEERIRARIVSPEGWISVLDTNDGFRWAWMVPPDVA